MEQRQPRDQDRGLQKGREAKPHDLLAPLIEPVQIPGGILLIQIAVGSLYMFSVPRGYLDGCYQWCKQVVGLCLTSFLQATILIAGLTLFNEHALLGLGLMLSAGEIPRIAGAFGLDTSTRANLSSAVYTAQTAINITKTENIFGPESLQV